MYMVPISTLIYLIEFFIDASLSAKRHIGRAQYGTKKHTLFNTMAMTI